MKRIISVLLALCLLLGLAGCGEGKPASKKETAAPEPQPTTPSEPYVPLEPYTYTELPTALKAEKVSTIPQHSWKTAEGGLYYESDDKFGIVTLDGKVDSGLVYALCQPKGRYFVVAKELGDMTDVLSANVVGLVDATGREIIPLQYASVEVLGDRFARVAELTGTTENAEEKLTQTTIDGTSVMCTGNWYLYDLQTGEKVPGATGTKPYISFDCGGYVKYVLDDKTVVTATPDGKAIPNDVLHLKNGHYAVEADYTVYDSDGNQRFTYDPEGYIPVNSEGFDDYILAKKQEGKKETYVLLDLTGQVVSAVFEQKPQMYGELLRVGDDLVTIQGGIVVEGGCQMVFWDALYGQTWAVLGSKTNKVVDKTGKVIFEASTEEVILDNAQMMCYKKGEGVRHYYSRKDKDFTITGFGVAPFVVRVPNGDFYDLVNVLTGEVILSGYRDYMVADGGDTILYVYAKTEDKKMDVFAIR